MELTETPDRRVYPVFTMDGESDRLTCICATAEEAEQVEARLALTGDYVRVSWEEKVVHDPAGSWTTDAPVYVVTDGIYEVTTGVFGDHATALAFAAAQQAGAITQVHTMLVGALS